MCTISSGFHTYPVRKGVVLFHCGRLCYGSKLFTTPPVRGLYDPACCHVICTASLWEKDNIPAPSCKWYVSRSKYRGQPS